MKIFILSIFEGFLEKVSENRPTLNLDFMWGLFSDFFSKIPSKRLKIKIFTFYGSFSRILSSYFDKCHKIKVVPNTKLGLVTFLLNSYSSSRVSKCKKMWIFGWFSLYWEIVKNWHFKKMQLSDFGSKLI